MLEISTQEELDKAITDGINEVCFIKKGTFEIRCKNWLIVNVSAKFQHDVKVTARDSSRVEARGSSSVVAWDSSRVEAWDSSSVEARGFSRVVARDSSSVEARGFSRVVARDSSSVVAWDSSSVVARDFSSVVARDFSRVVAWDSSRVEAWGSSRVEARGSSRVEARGFVSLSVFGKNIVKLSPHCHAFRHSAKAKITGGNVTEAILKTPQDWCDYYGVKVYRGLARVYKSLHKDFYNPYNRSLCYAVGTKLKAPDWDGGKNECHGGLHFSPTPRHAQQFYCSEDARYVEMWVSLKEMAVHFDGLYPQKAKAKRVMKPIVEVDIDGNPIKEAV